jgi:hypothetical protein
MTNTFWSVGDIEGNLDLLNTLRKEGLCKCALSGAKELPW